MPKSPMARPLVTTRLGKIQLLTEFKWNEK